ncbi:hypothetical protein C0J52_22447 [Blattella germanica]|nr:hypothetical protein C0J52_22447 [Blattella germanica]
MNHDPRLQSDANILFFSQQGIATNNYVHTVYGILNRCTWHYTTCTYDKRSHSECLQFDACYSTGVGRFTMTSCSIVRGIRNLKSFNCTESRCLIISMSLLEKIHCLKYSMQIHFGCGNSSKNVC